MHRNDSIRDNPDQFDPLQFSSNNFEKHGPYDYILFSAGSRNCINQFLLKVDESHKVEMVSRLVFRTENDIKLWVELLPGPQL